MYFKSAVKNTMHEKRKKTSNCLHILYILGFFCLIFHAKEASYFMQKVGFYAKFIKKILCLNVRFFAIFTCFVRINCLSLYIK